MNVLRMGHSPAASVREPPLAHAVRSRNLRCPERGFVA